MVASYVSARFEKADLYSLLGSHRCIVRNRDDGNVPPTPSSTYYPTAPDTLRDFLVLEYVNDVIGERFVRVATTADFVGLSPQQLTHFEVLGADFVAAGVLPGDVLTITLGVSQEWTSEEYAGLTFIVDTVVDPEHLSVLVPFPSFKTTLTWAITRGATPIASGTANGTTRRAGMPAPLDQFLDRRFNRLFASVPELDTYVEAVKAGMDALAASSTSSAFTNENYTSQV